MSKLIDVVGTEFSKMSIESRIHCRMAEEIARLDALDDEAFFSRFGETTLYCDTCKNYLKKYAEKLIPELIGTSYYTDQYLSRIYRIVPQTLDTNYKPYIRNLRNFHRRRQVVLEGNTNLFDGMLDTTATVVISEQTTVAA